jgi:inorganic pyrophosphatase
MPGYLSSTNTYFRVYKLPSGKKENDIAFDGEAKDKVTLDAYSDLHMY